MDYQGKSALMNLTPCIAMKHHPIALRKTVLMNSIAVHELIKQDRHVTYRKIEASWGISNSIHSILHELMSHPPYSPDLAPNDLFLFPHIKK